MSDNENEERYVESVSGIDPDEYNCQFDENYTDEGSTIDSSSVRNTRNVRSRTTTRQSDPGYNSVSRQVLLPNGKTRNTRVVFYETSSTPGMFIRDAVSGARYAPYRTGSCDEDLFFSVCLATGENGRKESAMLFYDNPEQY
jgi:hypothetical protein